MVHLHHPDDPDTIPHTLALAGDARWAAMTTSETGLFVITVASTCIYCRVGCLARQPLRQNVRFYGTVQDGRAAGYRACKRCHPDDEPAMTA